MSCFKCGRELPPGQVECEGACPDGAETGKCGSGQPDSGLPPFMVLHVEFKLDHSKMSTPAELAKYLEAVKTLAVAVKTAIELSGVQHYCQKR